MAAMAGATLLTLTLTVSVSVRPSLSVVVTVTRYTPSCANRRVAEEPPAVAPSPKSQEYETIEPLGSTDAAALNVPLSPSLRLVGPDSAAIGGCVLLSTAA